jgi:hypothetical protein
MSKFRFVGVTFVLFAIVFAGIMGVLTTGLWNLLMPVIFHLPTISFWQALGLLLLSRVLFGRLGGWGHRMRKPRFVQGWRDLTPEERERFRSAMDPSRRGNFGDGESSKGV